MSNIKIPEGATPGDVLRLIADWYDGHPDVPMPSQIALGRHVRDDKSAALIRLLVDKHGAKEITVPEAEDGTVTAWARLPLFYGDGELHSVTVSVFDTIPEARGGE
jgi:hypothetical protein